MQAIVSNYRGAHIKSIPEVAIPAVLARLVEACVKSGHLPPSTGAASPAYQTLWMCMDQFDELLALKQQLVSASK